MDVSAARAHIERLRGGRPFHLTVCTSTYDTAHESVADQVAGKWAELRAAFPPGGLVRPALLIASDGGAAFEREAQRGDPATRVVAVPAGGLAVTTKGRALRTALSVGLGDAPDALVYVNLNLKVDARNLAPALVPFAAGDADVVCGSRAPEDGGAALGNGPLGAAKSRVWSNLARTVLPQLAAFHDPNAPLKLMSPAAARIIVDEGRVDGLGFDAEWLCLWLAHGLRIARVPIVWTQRAGSRPPWELVPEMLVSLALTRLRFP